MGFSGTGKVWMNGAMVEWADAKVHIASHVIHYGTGVFEGIRCYETPNGSAIFRLQPHMRRLYDSARIYRMDYDRPVDELSQAVIDTIHANDMKACYIRPLIYRGYEALGVNPFPCPVDACILVWEWGAYLGNEAQEKGVDVGVSSWNRVAPNTFPSLAKATANYANAGLIKMAATLDGYAEGIALDTLGYVSEGSGQNIFLVRDNVLFTPAVSASILPGITRDSIATIAKDLGYEVRESLIQREALYIADEAFFVGTAVEVTPIRSIDHITIGAGAPGPVTKAIQRRFFDIINGAVPDTHGWLTFIGAPRATADEVTAGAAATRR